MSAVTYLRGMTGPPRENYCVLSRYEQTRDLALASINEIPIEQVYGMGDPYGIVKVRDSWFFGTYNIPIIYTEHHHYNSTIDNPRTYLSKGFHAYVFGSHIYGYYLRVGTPEEYDRNSWEIPYSYAIDKIWLHPDQRPGLMDFVPPM